MKEYRYINQHILISQDNFPAVEKMLADAEWEPLPTPTEEGILIAPRPLSGMAQSTIQILYDIAPYAQKSVAIWEVVNRSAAKPEDLRKWLHILYDGQGSYRTVETAPGQWEVSNE